MIKNVNENTMELRIVIAAPEGADEQHQPSLIDADPQGDLTQSLGWNSDKLDATLANVMFQTMNDRGIDVKAAMLKHDEGVDLIPSNLELSSLENYLVNAMSREKVLDNSIKDIKKDYDYIIIVLVQTGTKQSYLTLT